MKLRRWYLFYIMSALKVLESCLKRTEDTAWKLKRVWENVKDMRW